MTLRKTLIAAATAVALVPPALAAAQRGDPQVPEARSAGADGPMFPSMSARADSAVPEEIHAARLPDGHADPRAVVVAADGGEDMTAEAALGGLGKSRAEVRAEAVESNRTRVAGTATAPY